MRDNIIIDLILSKINTEKAFRSAISEAHELSLLRSEKNYTYNKPIEHDYFMLINLLEDSISYVNFTDLLYDTGHTGKNCILEALEELKEKGKA